MLELSLTDYYRLLQNEQPDRIDYDIPELNHDCIFWYVDLCEKFNIEIPKVYCLDNGLGFQLIDGGLNFPLSSCTSHVTYPFTLSELHDNATKYCEELQRDFPDLPNIITETFTPKHRILENDKDAYFLWLNSPIVEKKDSFEDYLTSLKKKRRYKVKEAIKQSGRFSFHFSRDGDRDFILENLKKHWRVKSDLDTAMSQYLWMEAVSGSGFYCSVFHGKKKVAMAYFILSGDKIVFQGIVQDEDNPTPNIGLIILSRTVKRMHSDKGLFGFTLLDPTCKTNCGELTGTDIYKRCIVNKDSVKPTLYWKHKNDIKPPFFDLTRDGWEKSDERVELFKGV